MRATLICWSMQVIGGQIEAVLLFRLAHKGLDHLDPGQVFLQNGVELRKANLHLDEQRAAPWRPKTTKIDHRHRQQRQDHQGQLEVGEKQDDQRC